MKIKHVAAAIIVDAGRIFATRRGHGQYKGFWELPGGKIEAGELPETAVKREVIEELDVEVEVEKLLCTVEYDYPDFHLSMQCFVCRLIFGQSMVLKEHLDAKWLKSDELQTLRWLPADIDLLPVIQKYLEEK